MASPPQDEFTSRHYPVRENMRWLRRSLLLEKIGYLLLFSFIGAALLGLFSNGWLSDSLITNSDRTVQLKYDRFARQQSEIQLVLHVWPQGRTPAVVQLGGDFVNHYEIVAVQPQTAQMVTTDQGMIITLPTSSASASTALYLTVQPKSFGRYRSEATLSGHPPLQFNQLVYP
ncbi:hypothetical protein CYR55_22210 [Chimaeribacter californicus]|uniref:Uncharacterized protein n=1 Tax=Chimaeribacter californicus TaxID=2060067 RepID=A0A2N5DUA5_9GAMM|nr:hypothetical protein [Chimaeribacter californicus]PLR30369.1 hypothetical protein CYR55_22210 [Chimaeribacter californicus]